MEHLFKNILFDLGGLFITVFTDRFEQWLIRWCPSGISSELFRVQFAELHHLYEQGVLSSSRFLTDVRSLLNNRVDESEIERAWDGILGSFSEEDLKWASALRSNFRTAILSNTNELHRVSFEEALRLRTNGCALADYFDGIYYSQHLGLRKPNADVFLRVLEMEGWHPEETLFVDDNQENLQSAAELGMRVVLHPCNAPLRLHLEARMDLPFHHFSSLS
ncbi:MAG: hypothetical protein RLZZ335_110 [Bacteroidota bacterium]